MDRDNKLEDVINWLNDNDQEWWPFLFMRPDKHVRMSEPRVMGIASLYGIFAGMLLNVMFATIHKDVNPLGAPMLGTLLCYVVFRLTFARAWNRRADRLARMAQSIVR